MDLKILQSNLNLRIEKGKTNNDYELKNTVAKKQLEYKDIDLYCNVEYMKCKDEEYCYEFDERGYKKITATFENNRGILCYIDKKIKIEIISKLEYPHFMHFRIYKNNDIADIIVFRILVTNSKEDDFKNRKEQWDIVMNYIDKIKYKSRLIMMGDWNHARILDDYELPSPKVQRYFNYQYIKSELNKRKITMGIDIGPGHKEHSWCGFLAIDHIAVGNKFLFKEKPTYSEYIERAPIGTPDHAFLFTKIEENRINC